MKVFCRKAPKNLDYTTSDNILYTEVASDKSEKSSREFEIVVLGATGFTG